MPAEPQHPGEPQVQPTDKITGKAGEGTMMTFDADPRKGLQRVVQGFGGALHQPAVGLFNRGEAELDVAKQHRPNKADWLDGAWSGFKSAPKGDRRGSTGRGPGTVETGTAYFRVCM